MAMSTAEHKFKDVLKVNAQEAFTHMIFEYVHNINANNNMDLC